MNIIKTLDQFAPTTPKIVLRLCKYLYVLWVVIVHLYIFELAPFSEFAARAMFAPVAPDDIFIFN